LRITGLGKINSCKVLEMLKEIKMKIAVESNDGVNIASPFNLLKNFMVFEVEEKSDPINLRDSGVQLNHENQLNHIKNICKSKNMVRELEDCSTVISHSLNQPLLNKLRKSGVDVFITYQSRIDDAFNQYLRDKRIHDFKRSN
jgi:predicted Fe-Mo cluster-binding NifX family protein